MSLISFPCAVAQCCSAQRNRPNPTSFAVPLLGCAEMTATYQPKTGKNFCVISMESHQKLQHFSFKKQSGRTSGSYLLAFARFRSYTFLLGTTRVTGFTPFQLPRCCAWYAFCSFLERFSRGTNFSALAIGQDSFPATQNRPTRG